jgi:hypothetical protein
VFEKNWTIDSDNIAQGKIKRLDVRICGGGERRAVR